MGDDGPEEARQEGRRSMACETSSYLWFNGCEYLVLSAPTETNAEVDERYR